KMDAELTARAYQQTSAMVDDGQNINPWRVDFLQLFHMSNDSKSFKTKAELEDIEATACGNVWRDKKDRIWVPLYEGKMISFYDPRYDSYESSRSDQRHRLLQEKSEDPPKVQTSEPEPFYWMPRSEVKRRVPRDYPYHWRIGFQKATGPS